jgi:hypothetical protein
VLTWRCASSARLFSRESRKLTRLGEDNGADLAGLKRRRPEVSRLRSIPYWLTHPQSPECTRGPEPLAETAPELLGSRGRSEAGDPADLRGAPARSLQSQRCPVSAKRSRRMTIEAGLA